MSDDGDPWWASFTDANPLENPGENLEQYILGVIAVFVVEQVLEATAAVLGVLSDSWAVLAQVPAITGNALGAAGAGLFAAIAALLDLFRSLLVELSTSLGLVGPILAALALLVVAIAVEAVVRWLVRLLGNYVGLT